MATTNNETTATLEARGRVALLALIEEAALVSTDITSNHMVTVPASWVLAIAAHVDQLRGMTVDLEPMALSIDARAAIRGLR